MKKYLNLLAVLVILGIGVIGGVTVIQVLAVGTWNPAPSSPPNLNAEAPINVGDYSQIKTGLLGLSNLIVNKLQVLTGEGTTTSTQGKVLTAIDGNGTVGWRSASGGVGSLQFAHAVMKEINNGNANTVYSSGDFGVTMLSGTAADAITLVLNTLESVEAVGVGSNNLKVDGMKCNANNGWHLTGCWEVFVGNDSDIWSVPNGCVTDDFRDTSTKDVALSIMCVK